MHVDLLPLLVLKFPSNILLIFYDSAGPFVPRPSLQFITNYLVVDCLRSISTDSCHVCNKRALPNDPKVMIMKLVTKISHI